MIDREQLLEEYEDVVLLENYDYDSALVGITTDNRAVYDYDLMVQYLLDTGDFDDPMDAVEWLEYNTIRAIGYFGEGAPIVMYSIGGREDIVG